MSKQTKEIASTIIHNCARDLLDEEFGALSRIHCGVDTVVETEALRLDRETMRIQSERIRCLEDELKEARAELKRREWQPIETAPKDEVVFCFWTPGGAGADGHDHSRYGLACCTSGTWHHPDNDEDDYCAPTHWMPLPKRPRVRS